MIIVFFNYNYENFEKIRFNAYEKQKKYFEP